MLAAIWFLRVNAFHDIVMQKVEKVYFLLRLQLNSFYHDKFLFVFLDTHIDDSSCCIEKAYDSLCQMHLDRLILQGPMIIFKLLIGVFSKLSFNVGGCFMLKCNLTAKVFLVLCLEGFCSFLEPSQGYFFERAVGSFSKQLSINKGIYAFSFVEVRIFRAYRFSFNSNQLHKQGLQWTFLFIQATLQKLANFFKYPRVSCINTCEEKLIAVCVNETDNAIQKCYRITLSFSLGTLFSEVSIRQDLLCSKLYERIEAFQIMKGDDHRQCLSLQAFLQMLQAPLKVLFPFVISMCLKGFYFSCYFPQFLQIFQFGIIVVKVHKQVIFIII